ncbi:hypothetical protein JTE90_024732 [Oedothorax gibbosus]|uniref:DDE-1 domain-containing protein n=1 Tax=Oedothorax gibbosus TaxID=931172 RepID=A0AAV6UB93_9ARAC|nr:hypothetical protein JTE90_024732 [Oedothorax gibbosus]
MPRNYVRKRVPSYSAADLDLAISEVKKGKTILAAARQYGIPFETLRRWIVSEPSHKVSGRSTIMTTEEENCIVQALQFLAQCGFPFDRQDVINVAQQYISTTNNTNCKSVGIEWARGLRKDGQMYTNVLSENGLENAPDRIFNLDEAGLGTDSRTTKVFVPRKSRIAYLKSADAGKAMYSVLFCVSASGNFLPPLTVFKSQHLYESWTKGGPPGAWYSCTESGWMHDMVFESWMGHFVKHVEQLEKPVLLIFDGHGSHLTYKTIKQAIDNEIIIICLPPNTSHALQPLDVGVFAPVKRSWRKILKTWYRESRLQKISKATFPYLLKQLFEKIASQKSIRTLCLKCEASVPSKTKEIKVSVLSTSNLIRHLQRHHSTETVEEFKASLSSAREEFVTTNPRRVRETRYQSSSSISQQSRFDGLIVDYVIHAMVPLQSVDDPTFHKIFNFLNISNRGLKVMSRRTLTRRLDTKYSKHVEETRETLKSVPWLCTTADIWSSGKRSFIGVTAHWIDENNERRSTALACSRVKGSHTYDRIATTLHGINCKYGLSPEKIVATVTDNGSNFIKVFRVFGHHLKSTNVEDNCDEELDNRGDDDYELWVSVDDDVVAALSFHLRCCAHTLALCASSDVHNAIKSNSGLLSLHESAMKKCNILWRISNRPKSAEVLEQIIGRSLPRPTETRWNSLYDSLKVIVAVKCHIEEINQKLHMTCSFSDEELTYLEEFVKCSKPVAEAIDILQGDKEAYYGSLLPTILAVRLKLQKLATSNLQYCRPIATAYLNSVNRRFVTFFELNTVAFKK